MQNHPRPSVPATVDDDSARAFLEAGDRPTPQEAPQPQPRPRPPHRPQATAGPTYEQQLNTLPDLPTSRLRRTVHRLIRRTKNVGPSTRTNPRE